ncbi:hypothetical protein CEXT_279871 [Caerostris extrusa]|uniref:Uncharacterized protein n=1 Tax=Caerostris extrusa TaxID=172846 RepID=A0AAV4XQK3_CAEEX|nr:hypothetical protein CEXT_279871 [Caerostris extrusa]
MRRPSHQLSRTEAGTEAVRRATVGMRSLTPRGTVAERGEPAITAVKLIMMCFSALPLFAYDGSPNGSASPSLQCSAQQFTEMSQGLAMGNQRTSPPFFFMTTCSSVCSSKSRQDSRSKGRLVLECRKK